MTVYRDTLEEECVATTKTYVLRSLSLLSSSEPMRNDEKTESQVMLHFLRHRVTSLNIWFICWWAGKQTIICVLDYAFYHWRFDDILCLHVCIKAWINFLQFVLAGFSILEIFSEGTITWLQFRDCLLKFSKFEVKSFQEGTRAFDLETEIK